MNAWIALGLYSAWYAADPAAALNRPRPLSAHPTPSSVIPASHHAAQAHASNPADIPPAPLPEFADVEAPRILFEFSKPESCTDSQVCPPAPPAEPLTAELPHINGVPKAHRHNVGWLANPFTDGVAISCDGTSTEDAYPVKLPATKDQLQHMQQAIEHLEAAGMKDVADELHVRYDGALQQLRKRQQCELRIKEAELQRLSLEIQLLRREIANERELAYDADGQTPAASASNPRYTSDNEILTEYGVFPSVNTPLIIQTPAWSAPLPMNGPTPPVMPDAWRRTFSQPIVPLSGTPDAEYAAPLPIPPVPAPFHLIPSPTTSGRPSLIFPLAPMRAVEDLPQQPDFELPPAPLPNEAFADSDEGPIV